MEIRIYDIISAYAFEASAEGITRALASADGEEIHLRVHSPGGDPLEAIAMRNALARYPGKIRVTVDGFAASAASYVIALPGVPVAMADGALLMIHRASGGVHGNAKDAVAMSQALERMDASMEAAYVARTGLSAERVSALMDAETWMSAQEAVDLGFADSVIEGAASELQAAQRFSLAAFAHPPRFLANSGETKTPCDTGDRMDPKEIRKRLGLPEDATEAEVFAALDAARPPAAPTTSEPAPAAAPAPEPLAALAAVFTPEQISAFASLFGKGQSGGAPAAAPEVDASAAHTLAATAVVNQAIASGKIAPRDRDAAIALCGTHEEPARLGAMQAYWASAPALVPSLANLPGHTDQDAGITPMQRRMAANAGLSLDKIRAELAREQETL